MIPKKYSIFLFLYFIDLHNSVRFFINNIPRIQKYEEN